MQNFGMESNIKLKQLTMERKVITVSLSAFSFPKRFIRNDTFKIKLRLFKLKKLMFNLK